MLFRSMRLCWVAAAGAAAVLCTTVPSFAQNWTPRHMGNRLGGDIDVWPAADFWLFSAGFFGQIGLSRHAFLDFDAPFAVGDYARGNAAFTLGNPTIGAHYGTRLGDHAAFYIGGTGSIPTHLGRGDNVGDYGVADGAARARALYDLHRFYPEYAYLRAPLGFELGFRPVFFRFEGDPVFWIPVGHDVRHPEFVIEQAFEFEALANIGVGGGARLQGVLFPTGDSDLRNINDGLGLGRNQIAELGFEPFFAYEPEPRGFFVRAGVLFGMNAPAGPPFDRDRVATIRVTLGGKW